MPMIKIDTTAIESAAGTISSLNDQLEATLLESQSVIQGLSNAWTGAASETMISSYNSFSAKYFSEYKELLNNYVSYLRQIAVGNYQAAEQQNLGIGSDLP